MQEVLSRFDSWHKTKVGYAVMGVVELAIAYVLGSLAINSASLWEYLFAFIFLAGALQNLVQIIRLFISKPHGKN